MTMLFEWVPKSTPGYRAALDNLRGRNQLRFLELPSTDRSLHEERKPLDHERERLSFIRDKVMFDGRFRYD